MPPLDVRWYPAAAAQRDALIQQAELAGQREDFEYPLAIMQATLADSQTAEMVGIDFQPQPADRTVRVRVWANLFLKLTFAFYASRGCCYILRCETTDDEHWLTPVRLPGSSP